MSKTDDCLYLQHIKSSNIYKVNNNAIKLSLMFNLNKTITLDNVSNDAVIFIVKYLNFYSVNEELPPPEHPLLDDISLIDIFELESHIFGDILFTTNIKKNISFINDIVKIATILKMEFLSLKLAAIMCYYTQSICPKTLD